MDKIDSCMLEMFKLPLFYSVYFLLLHAGDIWKFILFVQEMLFYAIYTLNYRLYYIHLKCNSVIFH